MILQPQATNLRLCFTESEQFWREGKYKRVVHKLQKIIKYLNPIVDCTTNNKYVRIGSFGEIIYGE